MRLQARRSAFQPERKITGCIRSRIACAGAIRRRNNGGRALRSRSIPTGRKLLRRLHQVEQTGLRSVVGQHRQRRLDRLHRHAQQRDRIQHGRIAQLGQLIERQQRAFAELGHVGHQRGVDLVGEAGELVAVGQRFGKNPIGSGRQIRLRPSRSRRRAR